MNYLIYLTAVSLLNGIDAGSGKSNKRIKSLATNLGGLDIHVSDHDSEQGSARSERVPTYSNEYHLKEMLLRGYDKTTRPVSHDNTTTTVTLGISLFHILNTNEKMQTFSALISVRARWVDELMTWDPRYHGNVTKVWIPSQLMWLPDIFISNLVDDSFKDFHDTSAIVSYTGEVLWMFPAVVETFCDLDVRHFPFDSQVCDMVFISWTYHGFKVNLTTSEDEINAVYYMSENQQWKVTELTTTRREKIYACCPEPYPDVRFSIHLSRRSLFYVVNFIFPCLLIYAASFLGFFLPVESGEKVNFQITILLALVVFLLIGSEILPPTPNSIPVLGLLYALTMVMVSIALVLAVIVTNIHTKKETGEQVPRWFQTLCFRCCRSGLTPKIIEHQDDHVVDHVVDHVDDVGAKNGVAGTPPRPLLREESERRFGLTPARTFSVIERANYDWKTVAIAVDRTCFYVFLCLSLAAFAWIFLSIPDYTM